MDISPVIPAGRQIIEGYGDGGFRVSGTRYEGSLLVFPTRVLTWPVRDMAAVSPESLSDLIATAGEVDLLLLGCGVRLGLVPPAVRRALKGGGIVVEAMDTGAACRTYNVLMGEDRRVAAALLAV